MARQPQYFQTAAEWRAWLQKNHRTVSELHVGYVKVHAHSKSVRCMTWAESVDESLCFGWIDGVRRRIDADRYVIRFTPRRQGSKWSAINVRKVAELEAAGRMREAGRVVFESRRHKTGPLAKGYTYQQRDVPLGRESAREFKRDKAAWAFFAAQPPGYRRLVSWWVMSAKKEETREKRLRRLAEWSGRRKRLV